MTLFQSNNSLSERAKAFGSVALALLAVLGTIFLDAIGKELPQILLVIDGSCVGFFFGVSSTNGQRDKITENAAYISAVDEARIRHEERGRVAIEQLTQELVKRGVISPTVVPPLDPAHRVTPSAAAEAQPAPVVILPGTENSP